MKDVIAAPVRTFRPLSEEAYDVLRAAILGGRLQPGARIVEADIARQMETSRSPIREAVRKLEHEGLVEYMPRRGTVVVGSSAADVADAYQLRAHLEAYGARLAATQATQAQLARLLDLIEHMRACVAAGDLDGLVAADVDFHRSVGDIIRSHVLELDEGVLAGLDERVAPELPLPLGGGRGEGAALALSTVSEPRGG